MASESLYIYDISHYLNDSIDRHLFYIDDISIWHQFVLPVIAGVGVLSNLITVFIYHHPDMRCMSTLFLKSALVADTVQLMGYTLINTSLSWLPTFFTDGNVRYFIQKVTWLQNIIIVCYPMADALKVLRIGCSVLLILEQYASLALPDKRAKWQVENNGVKAIFTLLSFTMLVHLLNFFKFTRRRVTIVYLDHIEMAVGLTTEPTKQIVGQEICLSQIYRNSTYHVYEKYVYFILLHIAPWICAFVALILTLHILNYLRREGQDPMPGIVSAKMVRKYKNGRSIRTVSLLTLVFLITEGCIIILHIVNIQDIQYESLHPLCHLTPVNKKFSAINTPMSVLYRVIDFSTCVMKPYLCFVANKTFRRMLFACRHWQKTKIGRKSRQVFLVLDPRRSVPKDTPSSPTSKSLINDHRRDSSSRYLEKY